jgi:hypothetical protein
MITTILLKIAVLLILVIILIIVEVLYFAAIARALAKGTAVLSSLAFFGKEKTLSLFQRKNSKREKHET